jgi:hypothetical protein
MAHDHDLDPAAWTDEPGSQPARDAHDDGAEQRRPETRNVEPVAQQGYRSEHPALMPQRKPVDASAHD